MKCLTEFARWKLSLSVHTVVHPSEVWSSSWDACEQYYAPYIDQLESKIRELTIQNEKLARHNDELILDLHLYESHHANRNSVK
jgi:hypothetical protein